jgi:adenylate cyclase
MPEAYLEREGKRTPVTGALIQIGRDPGCEIHLQDQQLSRKHALLVRSGSGFEILDYKSRNGISVNGRKTERSFLQSGDEIQLGSFTFRFVQEHAETSATRIQETPLLDALGAPDLEAAQTMMMKASGAKVGYSALEKLMTLYQIGKVINSELELPVLMDKIIDQALKVMRADRGCVMLKDDASGELVLCAYRAMKAQEIEGRGAPTPSRSIVQDVVRSMQPVLTSDALLDERFDSSQSIQMYNIRSAMCVPLTDKERKLTGILYVDNLAQSNAFHPEDLKLLSAFADQAAIAVENAKLYLQVQKEIQRRTNLSRYLSPAVVDKIIHSDQAVAPGGEKRDVSILFADIRNFTPLAESLPSHEVVDLLNQFLDKMTQKIFAEQGTLDKYTGDGLMAIFGAPLPMKDHALRAVRAALAMQQEMTRCNEQWKPQGLPDLQIGIAIHSGETIVGNIGSSERVDYTAIGDVVNTAARLEGIAEGNEVVISKATLDQVGKQAVAQTLQIVPLKGKSQTVPIYRVLSI